VHVPVRSAGRIHARTLHSNIKYIDLAHIIHEGGLTWKVLERRAMHIKEQDVFRFTEKLRHVEPTEFCIY